MQYRGEERSAKDKFLQIIRGIKVCDTEGYNLESLVKESNTSWATPEWGFPKGRRNYQENDLNRIVRYCENDTVAVAQLVLRFLNLPILEHQNIISV